MTKEEIREMAAWAWEEMERVKSALEKENEYGLVPIVDMDNGYILASYGEGLKMLGLDDDGEEAG